jgi:hypothetical protein
MIRWGGNGGELSGFSSKLFDILCDPNDTPQHVWHKYFLEFTPKLPFFGGFYRVVLLSFLALSSVRNDLSGAALLIS